MTTGEMQGEQQKAKGPELQLRANPVKEVVLMPIKRQNTTPRRKKPITPAEIAALITAAAGLITALTALIEALK